MRSEQRHRVPRRDRQDLRARRPYRRRRLARRRAARPAAADRRHDGLDQARCGQADHVLFIASGAFHIAKPSDLLPELQGRLPIRVELEALTRDDMRRILTEPEASLIKQYVALMQTEGVTLDITDGAIDALAESRSPSIRRWKTSARGACRQ